MRVKYEETEKYEKWLKRFLVVKGFEIYLS